MFETLGQYKILERIGAGGMGDVYRGRDTRLGRTVAIKVLASAVANDPDRRERFMREARAAAALSHPNIAALYEVGEDQGELFLAFEFVPGETLRSVIAGRPLNPRRAIDLATQIADALADAHAEGIVHRDIKPDNIIVTPKGNAKILDFGLATWTAGGARREHAADQQTVMVTNVGTALGTVAYMSPEQALGERVDHRTDIFSLGIVLFEMLTGKLPFNGSTSTAMALQIVQAPLPPLSSVNRSVPRELDAIAAKALAKSLGQRYESAATMAAELRSLSAILDVRTHHDDKSAAAMPVTSSRRRRSWVRPIVGHLFAAAVIAAGWLERAPLTRLYRQTLGPAPAPIIAVVPFETEPDQTFFADGLAEDLITRLGQTPGLRVIGRSATRTFRGRRPIDVARELGAAVVLTGSVRPLGDAVKVSLELIDPIDGTDVWAAQFTRDVKDIFAVQADVAEHVAQALRVKLQPTASSARAAARLVDPRAYDLYLRGRAAAAARRSGEAIRLFESSIASDAGLAEAHAGLAEALIRQASFAGQDDDPVMVARAQAEIEAAFRADPELPQAHLAAARLATSQPDVAPAFDHLRAALNVDPSNAMAYHVAGDILHLLWPERATEYYRASLELDPTLDASRGDMARALLLQRRRDAAAAQLAASRTDPVGARPMIAEYDLLTTGRTPQPVDARPGAGAYLAPWVRYARGLRHVGRADEARAILDMVIRDQPAMCEAAALAGRAVTVGPDAPPAIVRCGAVASAVSADAARTASFIDRMAEHRDVSYDDTELVADLIRFDETQGWYPWSRVSADARVGAAAARLHEQAMRIKEDVTPRVLPLPSGR